MIFRRTSKGFTVPFLRNWIGSRYQNTACWKNPSLCTRCCCCCFFCWSRGGGTRSCGGRCCAMFLSMPSQRNLHAKLISSAIKWRLLLVSISLSVTGVLQVLSVNWLYGRSWNWLASVWGFVAWVVQGRMKDSERRYLGFWSTALLNRLMLQMCDGGFLFWNMTFWNNLLLVSRMDQHLVEGQGTRCIHSAKRCASDNKQMWRSVSVAEPSFLIRLCRQICIRWSMHRGMKSFTLVLCLKLLKYSQVDFTTYPLSESIGACLQTIFNK